MALSQLESLASEFNYPPLSRNPSTTFYNTIIWKLAKQASLVKFYSLFLNAMINYSWWKKKHRNNGWKPLSIDNDTSISNEHFELLRK